MLVCDLLLVISANLPPILHRFQVMADCLVFNHLREHEGWPHHEPLIATDICLPQLSTVVQLTTLSKM